MVAVNEKPRVGVRGTGYGVGAMVESRHTDMQLEGNVYRGGKQKASRKQQFAHLAWKARGVNYTSSKPIIRYLSRTRGSC